MDTVIDESQAERDMVEGESILKAQGGETCVLV